MPNTSYKADLFSLREQLLQENSLEKRLTLIKNFEENENFFHKHPYLHTLFDQREPLEQLVLFSLVVIGQGEKLCAGITSEGIDALLDVLLPVETFYREIGGIIGYHLLCLELLAAKKTHQKKGRYHLPQAKEIGEKTKETRRVSIEGIFHLDQMAEMYPIGGAADRLSLKDEMTGEFQSAAILEFFGKTLVERLVEDVQAKEYLHYKLYGKQVRVPLVMMTSDEKKNDTNVKEIFQQKGWFGRRCEDFFLFSQPLVPTMTKRGEWVVLAPHKPFLKPGGHGAIWKLSKESGALAWLEERGVKKILVRQINNIIAGVDDGLCSFLGIGFEENQLFGFASCPKKKGMSEGVNVVIEDREGFRLTCIEYCDFEHFEIHDSMPLLANTNLLFVDLCSIEHWLKKNPLPGMLVNAKKMKIPGGGEEEILRLESTMQNLCDGLIEESLPLQKSYLTSNRREKTISTIKKEYAFGSSLLQTPEQCFLDMLKNGRELLLNNCGFELPDLGDEDNFFHHGPPFLFLYHSALGPHFEIIGQKLRGGRLSLGSEFRLNITEIDCENLDIDGSFLIDTEAPLGHLNEEGVIIYSNQTGKCTLKNVIVRNSGIHPEASRCFWKDEIVHKEKCEILIEEGGEFFAENVLLRGDIRIRVPSGVRITASMERGALHLEEEVLPQATWNWKYEIGEDFTIQIKKDEKL